jgi:dipeptidase E
VKLLLTSAGIRNPSIHAALVELLPKPIADCDALCIPTGSYGHPLAGPGRAWNFVAGAEPRCPMTELGWRSVGVLELTALPSLARELWVPWVEAADVLLVNGGDATFIGHWMKESGLDELLPSLAAVWVGLSGGSMVLTPRIGADFVNWPEAGANDETLGLVDFSIFPHVDHPDMPDNSMAVARRWAAELGNPAYAIDDETAIAWVEGEVEVVSAGHWQFFEPLVT